MLLAAEGSGRCRDGGWGVSFEGDAPLLAVALTCSPHRNAP